MDEKLGESMNRYFISGMFVALLSLAAGCSDPKIDASTDKDMKASIQMVRDSLSDSKRVEFDEALEVLVFQKIDMESLIVEGLAGPGSIQGDVRRSLNGKTADEVIAEANGIYSGQHDRGQAQSLEELNLEEKTEALLSCLQGKVTLDNPQFVDSDGSSFQIDITNNLSWAVRCVHFAYIIKGDGRSVPVMEHDSSREISGGIEPGETRTIEVWAGANIASYSSTSIEVSLINVTDAENRKLIDNDISYVGWSYELSPNGCN